MTMKFYRIVKTVSTQLSVKKNLQIFSKVCTEHAPKNLMFNLNFQYETFALNQITGTSNDTCPRSFKICRVLSMI